MSPDQPMPARALCVAGPTASGKTAAALAIAEALRGARAVEVISVDSALVYRGLDIGTAKPSAAERAAVPHHLIDVIEPSARYSAARFVDEANALIDEINARGALPLLVGGTMLYFKALLHGLDAMPAADAAVRARISADAEREGWPALHAELARVDPVTASRVAPRDSQRIQRALEVHSQSGRPISSFHRDRDPESVGERNATMPLPLPMIALEPLDRAWLHERIDRRFEAMLASGFVDEMRRLRARGDLDAAMPSMRSVGYRQAWLALDCGDLSALASDASAATRQLAKRQLTWLRSMRERHVVACDAPDAMARAVDLAKRLAA